MNEELKQAEKRYREYDIALKAWQAGEGDEPCYDEMPEDSCRLADFALPLLDGTPLTRELLIAAGGLPEDHPHKVLFQRGEDLPIGIWDIGDGKWKAVLWLAQNHSVTIARGFKTMGELRTLAAGLEIGLKEPTEGKR